MDKDLDYLKKLVQEKSIEPDRPMTCTSPDCDCVAIAEAKNGGPVKSYPCRSLANLQDHLLKSPRIDEIKGDLSDRNKKYADTLVRDIKAVIENYEQSTGLTVLVLECAHVSMNAGGREISGKKVTFSTAIK